MTTTLAASPFTATDRCDRCGAQAYVRATLGSGFDLLFCGHHWYENEAKLRGMGAAIENDLARLTATPATAAVEER